jgi:large subunit ribosomal protein L19|tara:strand:+ start:24262 stop:24675 length:414 start_codon:yes stop_codon:yes gene_type:complete
MDYKVNKLSSNEMIEQKIERIKNHDLLKEVESNYLNSTVPLVRVGDTVKLGVKIQEGNKTRTQFFQGVVISKANAGLNKTITVRRVMQGIGIERCFLIHSPKLQSIEVLRSAKVRRSKLYYLRKLSGKATRLKQSFK